MSPNVYKPSKFAPQPPSKGVKKLNNMLERLVSGEHKAGALFYLHATMLEDQDLVLRQFADMLGVRRLVDTDQAYDDLVGRIWDQLPEALEVANATSTGRFRRRHRHHRRRLSGVPSAHSRLGKVRNNDALEEVRSMCEWAGKATVVRMDKFLYGDGSMTFKYSAALFPQPASIHCEEDGSTLDADEAGGSPKKIGAGGAKGGGGGGSGGRGAGGSLKGQSDSVGGAAGTGAGTGVSDSGDGEASAAWVRYGAAVGVVGTVAVAVQFFRGRSARRAC